MFQDEFLAKFVVDSHSKHHPNAQVDTEPVENEHDNSIESISLLPTENQHISQDLLKKYIVYAKERIHPRLHHTDKDSIVKMYSELRRESMSTESIPITVRHVESIIRISEAHAKMHLREYVNDNDVKMAFRVVLDSFVDTQKFSVMRTMRKVALC